MQHFIVIDACKIFFLKIDPFSVVSEEERKEAEENGDQLPPPEDLEEVLNDEEQITENGRDQEEIENETNENATGEDKQTDDGTVKKTPETKPKPPPVKPKQSLLDPVTLSWEETKLVCVNDVTIFLINR